MFIIQELLEKAQNYKSLLISVGFIVLPKIYSFIVDRRMAKKSLPFNISIAIVILIFTGITQVIYSQYFYKYEPNIILLTNSRVQTPSHVINSRLLSLNLTGYEKLINNLQTKSARALYTVFGPALGDCEFCDPIVNNQQLPSKFKYILYLLPEVIWPYVLNCGVILLLTIFVPALKQFQFFSIISLIFLSSYDLYEYHSYPFLNALSSTGSGTEWFYWNKLKYRGFILFSYNAIVCFIYYLSGTGRLFTSVDPIETRILRSKTILHQGLEKLRAVNLLRSLIRESDDYRNKSSTFWQNEINRRGQLEQDQEVQNARQDALQRLDTKARSYQRVSFVNSYA